MSPTDNPIIIAEEPDFLVVAKPPHLLSHPTRPDGQPSLLGWLQEKYPGEFVALVNRLDRETSGTILIARSPEAASKLGTLTMQRGIHKYYLAIVSGQIREEHGIIEAPIGRLGISEENPIWLRRGVILPDDPQGRKADAAKTEYWRLATGPIPTSISSSSTKAGPTNTSASSSSAATRSTPTK
jgi:23S rRNA pseudouridine1911/1915/1917 synthase